MSNKLLYSGKAKDDLIGIAFQVKDDILDALPILAAFSEYNNLLDILIFTFRGFIPSFYHL